jgi:DNA-binding transcriptional ArsR family regulator
LINHVVDYGNDERTAEEDRRAVVTDPLSLTFAALADPTRRAILSRLAQGEATVNALAEPFEMSLQAVSKHVQVLERAGLVTKGRDAQYRPCHLEPAPLEPAIDWLDEHRRLWEDRFDQLEAHLRKIQADQQGRARTDRKSTGRKNSNRKTRTERKEPS